MRWLQSWHRNQVWSFGLLFMARADSVGPYPLWTTQCYPTTKKGQPGKAVPFETISSND